MYYHEFKFEDNMEEINDIVFTKTNKKIEQIKKILNDEVFTDLCEDIEEWMFERFDNVRNRYFNGIIAFLLDKDYTYVEDGLTLEKWLKEIGHTQQSFRKKIYEDNKEIINEAITYDAAYEALKNIFSHSYFKHWDFNDISAGYPQSYIVRDFMKKLINKNGFNEEIKNMLDQETKVKMSQLESLKKELAEIQNQIEEIDVG